MTIKQKECPLRNRFDFLDDAKIKVADRGEQYGTVKDNFETIAGIWSQLLKTKVTPAQVALCMIGVKQSRLIHDPESVDSWVDLAGYGACGGEVTRPDDV